MMGEYGPELSAGLIPSAISKMKNKLGTPQFWYWYRRGAKPITGADHTVLISISKYLGDYREVGFFERNEMKEMNDILSEVRSDDVFLDIGANIGIHSIFADKLVDEVYSIEPHPVNSSHLLVNKHLNDSELNIYMCAFSDTSQYVELSSPRGGLLADGSSALSDFQKPSKEGPSDQPSKINVRAEKGDDILKNECIPSPDVIKIDVEGAESRVIDGLQTTFADENCRLVYCEVHLDYVDYEYIRSQLENHGFDIEIIDERSYCKTIKAVRTSKI
mgnify:FL=1